MTLPTFGWKNGPNGATPLSAAELETFGLHIADYFESGQSPSVVTDASASPKKIDSTGTSGAANTANQGLVFDSSSGLFKSKRVLLNEPTSSNMTYTVYLDVAFGNDANDGQTPGTGVRTLNRAVALLQQAGAGTNGHGGLVKIISGANAGNIDCATPISIVQPIKILGLTPSSSTIRRTFGTPNGRSVWDAVTTAAGSSVSSATAAFTNADSGRIVSIYGTGVGGGTYYDFFNGNPPSGTVANLTATTTIARNSTTDPHGVKMSIVGDWNRVVTDASMTAGSGAVVSPTANWTIADIGTEAVVAGAGTGGQALRTAIKSVQSTTQATGTGIASATVSGKRCAIGVNFGDLLTFHAGQGGIDGVVITDQTANTGIGAALKIVSEDGGAGSQLSPSDLVFNETTFTSTGAAGAWEHIVDCDGSWNQNTGGPGVRRVAFDKCKFFGSRQPAETLRLVNPVHWTVDGIHVFDSSPTAIGQGTIVLDPQATAGVQAASVDVDFKGEGSYLYNEGTRVSWYGRLTTHGIAVSGRVAIEMGKTSEWCQIVVLDSSPSPTVPIDNGLNNSIITNFNRRSLTREAIVKQQRGILGETWDLIAGRDYPTSVATAGTIWAALAGFIAGDVIGHLGFYCLTSAGSGLTLAKVGVWSPSGTLLASSADFHASLATGLNVVALSSTYTVPSDSGLFIGLVTVGTTGPTLVRNGATPAVNGVQVNGGTPQTIQFGTVSDIGNVTGYTIPGGVGFWLAAY